MQRMRTRAADVARPKRRAWWVMKLVGGAALVGAAAVAWTLFLSAPESPEGAVVAGVEGGTGAAAGAEVEETRTWLPGVEELFEDDLLAWDALPEEGLGLEVLDGADSIEEAEIWLAAFDAVLNESEPLNAPVPSGIY